MAEYLPYALPGDIVTFDAGAAIVAGNLVKVGAADMAVIPTAAAADDKTVGVAAADAASGARVAVYILGTVHRCIAAGAVTRGDRVGPGAVAGAVTTIAAAATPTPAEVNLNARAARGIALESIIDTGTGRVMFGI